MELQQRLASFEQLQRRTRDAEAADNPGKLKQLEDKAEGARRDMAGCQERMEAMAPRIEQARKLLQDKDALRRQIEVMTVAWRDVA
jgi:DNA repair exonuclease SbcCD ATPase subunit